MKRPLAAVNTSQLEGLPPAKKRQLPNNWEKQTISIKPNKPGAGASLMAVKTQSSSAPSKRVKAPTHLSHEQTEILKLAQEGKSVFYTGSAGKYHNVFY